MSFVKFFWIFSLLGFLATLVITYIYLPEQVVLSTDANQLPEQYIARAIFFYGALGVVVFFNGALLVLGKSIRFVPSVFLPAPKRGYWMQDAEHRARFYKRFEGWIKGIGLCVNLCAIIALLQVQVFHDTTGFTNYPTDTLYMLVAGLAFLWLCLYYPLFGIWLKKLD